MFSAKVISISSSIDESAERAVEFNDSSNGQKKGASYLQTLMNMLNGFIGSGILTMPSAFKDGGLIVASILNPCVGMLSCLCIHMLVHINREVMKFNKSKTPYSYAELGREAFKLVPSMTKYANIGKIVVTTAVIGSSFGGCCVYFVFIGSNLETFFRDLNGGKYIFTKEECFLLIMPFIIMANSIRSVKTLAYFSMISNIFQLTGISIIFYNMFTGDITPETVVDRKYERFFVSTLFIFEGISVAVGLFKEIDKPRDFYKPTGVLNMGLLIITIFYWSVGFFGFRKYGSATKGAITLNLPNEPLYTSVRALYSCAVTLTYPLVMYVPLQEFWPPVKKISENYLIKHGYKTKTQSFELRIYAIEMVFRAFLVLCTYVPAALIPNVDKIVGLAGAMTSSLSAVVIPAALYLMVFWNHPSNKGMVKVAHFFVCIFIIIIGFYGFIFGVIGSIKDIIHFDPEEETSEAVEYIQSKYLQNVTFF